MEPSTNVDGDCTSAAPMVARPSRFNGAVDERRRRPTSRSFASRMSRCFNGAVDERRRRHERRRRAVAVVARFNGAVDERRRRHLVPAALELLRVASMEPSTNVDGDWR